MGPAGGGARGPWDAHMRGRRRAGPALHGRAYACACGSHGAPPRALPARHLEVELQLLAAAGGLCAAAAGGLAPAGPAAAAALGRRAALCGRSSAAAAAAAALPRRRHLCLARRHGSAAATAAARAPLRARGPSGRAAAGSRALARRCRRGLVGALLRRQQRDHLVYVRRHARPALALRRRRRHRGRGPPGTLAGAGARRRAGHAARRAPRRAPRRASAPPPTALPRRYEDGAGARRPWAGRGAPARSGRVGTSSRGRSGGKIVAGVAIGGFRSRSDNPTNARRPRGNAKMTRCLYEVLGVEKDADDDALKRAYRKQALVWHPGEVAAAERAPLSAAAPAAARPLPRARCRCAAAGRRPCGLARNMQPWRPPRGPVRRCACSSRMRALRSRRGRRPRVPAPAAAAMRRRPRLPPPPRPQTRTCTAPRRRTRASRRSRTPTRSSATSTSVRGEAQRRRGAGGSRRPPPPAAWLTSQRSRPGRPPPPHQTIPPNTCPPSPNPKRYDDHRDQILRSGVRHQAGGDGGYEGGGGRPAEEEEIFGFFSSACFSGYGDDERVRGGRGRHVGERGRGGARGPSPLLRCKAASRGGPLAPPHLLHASEPHAP
jgi:hypothetical protein